MTQVHPEHSPDESVHAEAGAQVQVVKVGLGRETLAVIAVLLVAVAGCTLVMGLNLAKQSRLDEDAKATKTQLWLVERRLMDREALDIIHGDKLASDSEYGPTGNLQRMKPRGTR